jgi:hypothetical protein
MMRIKAVGKEQSEKIIFITCLPSILISTPGWTASTI